MTKDIDIIHMTQWANSGCLLKDFYEIFNIPYPTYEEISKAISHLSELFETYSWYMVSTSTNNTRGKIEEHFKLLLADIFGELGVLIKLAGEGYIDYSLKEIRSVLDLLFAGLFTISSWTSDSQESDEGINPMAEAFFSGYWGKMNVLSLDSLVLPTIKIGEEDKGKQAIISLGQLTDKFYLNIISEFNFKIHKKEELKLKKSLSNSLSSFFINLIKDSNEWSNIAKEILGKTEHFYEILMNNNEATLRACENHEEKMLKDLSQKLGIDVILTEDIKQKFLPLTFKVEECNSILCNYCEDKATIYGIYSRPDTRAMSKLIKLQLKEEEVNGINLCIKESFKNEIGKNAKDSYFGDIIYSEIYSKLNDYVHSNITEKPTISQWFYDFFVPTIIVLQCILSRPLWATNQNK
jgi:hypothetical protein